MGEAQIGPLRLGLGAKLFPPFDVFGPQAPDIAKEVPIIPRWKEVFLNAVPRPSARSSAATRRS